MQEHMASRVSHLGRPNTGGARRLARRELYNGSTSAWVPAYSVDRLSGGSIAGVHLFFGDDSLVDNELTSSRYVGVAMGPLMFHTKFSHISPLVVAGASLPVPSDGRCFFSPMA